MSKHIHLTPEDIDRFWSHVDMGEPDACWSWLAYRSHKGYGRFWTANGTFGAHRVAYYLKHGDPAQQCVCHTCDDPACCNPQHLWTGTNQNNVSDKVQKLRHLRGETHPGSKLTNNDVIGIRESLDPSGVAAKRYGISDGTVRLIRQHRSWKHIPQTANEPAGRGRGELCAQAKLTESDVVQIKRSSEPSRVLAARFSISRQSIADIRAERTWAHVSA